MPLLRILYRATPDYAHASDGFSHLLIPPAVPGIRHGDRFLAASLDLELTAPARGSGSLLLDVTLDAVAAGSPAAASPVFENPDPDAVLDPRHAAEPGAAHARATDPIEAAALGAFWAARFAAWHAEGVAGFRLLGLPAFSPAVLRALLGPIRAAVRGGLLLAWAPGLSPEQVAALRGAGLDGIFGSLPWWDFGSDWFWDEHDRLRAVAPVLMAPEMPHGPGLDAVAWQRAASLAFAGAGWMALDGRDASTLNRALLRSELAADAALALPLGTAERRLALLRTDAADARFARRALLVLLNTDLEQMVAAAPPMEAGSGRFRFTPPETAWLRPGEWVLFAAAAPPVAPSPAPPDPAAAAREAGRPRLAVEAPSPAVDGGAFPVKAVIGDTIRVQADIVFDGHAQIAAALRWRGPGETKWREVAMRPLGNDAWEGAFACEAVGRHEYQVIGWHDAWESWRDEVAKKQAAGVDTSLELIEGAVLLREVAGRSGGDLASIAARVEAADEGTRREIMLSPAVQTRMHAAGGRPHLAESAVIPVFAERTGARFAAWYELFPRSYAEEPGQHGTFRDVIGQLPRIAAMGFDVLYLPPIHPIGRRGRKGPNNTLDPGPEDPGSPYAIGGPEGGHDALHPELGGFEDFAALRDAAAEHGMELALDFAIQCSPDHPWLREHRGWFDWRPDGSLKYAENPPKKYQDIVNVDFYATDAVPGLWIALCRVVLFWCSHGIRLFRVDNPHTKPFPFWEWLIAEVRARYPDAIFLAEAFTRSKIMYRLAKIGFSQSYTYFTWRNAKSELTAYFQELADGPPRDFFRPHLFVNTPDINPVFLQHSGRAGFLIRAALAATLSGLWGLYSGFELCEAAALEGREEYLDSEKYELRRRDWTQPGNIAAEIAGLNRARRRNRALQTHLGLTFLNAYNEAVLAYEKATPDRSNVVLVVVSLDPHGTQAADFEVPLWRWQLPDSATVAAEDLMEGGMTTWQGKIQHVTLDAARPFRLWRVRPGA